MNPHSTKEIVTVAVAACAIVTLLIAWVTPLASAEEVEPAPVFTSAQAKAGKAAFDKNCAACHMPDLSGDADAPPLAGNQFMSSWRGRQTKDLYQYMSSAMPPGMASLGTDIYTSITAYILQSNGAVAGPDPLTMTTAVPIGIITVKKR